MDDEKLGTDDITAAPPEEKAPDTVPEEAPPAGVTVVLETYRDTEETETPEERDELDEGEEELAEGEEATDEGEEELAEDAEETDEGEEAPAAKSPPSRRMARRKLPPAARRALLALCVAGMLASAAYIGNYVLSHFRQRAVEDRGADLVANLPPIPSYVITNPLPSAQPSSAPSDGPVDINNPAQPDTPPPRPDFKSRFESILEINEDFYGLLSLPAVGIENSFVVQGKDNSHYLYYNFEGKRDSHGTLFLDSTNSPYFYDKNYVIHGHNMYDGTMFNYLPKYAEIKTYLKDPVIVFDTIYGPTYWLIFAAYVTESVFNYYHTYFPGDSFEELLEEIYMRSNYHTNVDVQPTDTLLTLSTCNYTFQDARFTVQARLLREGESLEDFVPEAEKNTNKKSYQVQKQMRIAQMPSADFAHTYNTALKRNYYFRPGGEGIEWHVGLTLTAVQGPYTAWKGTINQKYHSWLASAASTTAYKRFYIVGGGLSGSGPGLFALVATGTPGNAYSLASKTAVTPAGVDARWPALYAGEDGNVVLVYTVDEEDERVFYKKPLLTADEPERVYAAPKDTDPRPVTVAETDSGYVLLVLEFEGGGVTGVYLDEPEAPPVVLDLPDMTGRFHVYYDLRQEKLKYVLDDGGTMKSGDFPLDVIPPYPAEDAALPPDGELVPSDDAPAPPDGETDGE
jgi:sortase B